MSKKTKNAQSLRSDRWLLAISMGISFFFWIMLKMAQDYDYSYTIPIAYQLPEGYAFRQMPPEELKVSVHGKGWDLLRFNWRRKRQNLPITINSTTDFTLYQGALSYQLNTKLKPFKLQVKSITPEAIQIFIDPLDEKKVPLVLKGKVQAAAGFHLLEPPSLNPDSVLLTGAKSLLSEIPFWETDTLSLTIKSSTQTRIAVKPPPNKTLLKIKPEESVLTVKTEPLVEKEFYLPVQIVHAPASDSLRIFPEQVLVKAIVGMSQYDQLQAQDFEVTADFSEIRPGIEQTTLALQLTKKPEYIESVVMETPSIEFFFEKK